MYKPSQDHFRQHILASDVTHVLAAILLGQFFSDEPTPYPMLSELHADKRFLLAASRC